MSVKRHKKLYAATPHNDLLEFGRVEHIYFRLEHTYFGLEHTILGLSTPISN